MAVVKYPTRVRQTGGKDQRSWSSTTGFSSKPISPVCAPNLFKLPFSRVPGKRENKMRRFAIILIAFITVFGLVLGIGMIDSNPVSAAKDSSGLKPLMGDNFGKMQVILINLITANYKGLPQSIENIRDHAIEISAMSPASVITEADRKMFSNYAFSMERQAENMLTVLRELINHDRAQTTPGMMNIDYLRVVAARHYGELVTTCVLCHNQFRRTQVQ